MLVTDLGANGLRPKKDGSLMDSADMASRSYTFDGDWKKLGWGNPEIMSRLGDAFMKKVNTRVPKGLDWDLFLGCAHEVEYHPIYHPFNWRGWVDWGQGALGDMGAHIVSDQMLTVALSMVFLHEGLGLAA